MMPCCLVFDGNFLQQNQLDAIISQIYFRNKILHVSDSSSVHHQEFFTLHTAMVCVIQVLLTACEQDQEPDVMWKNMVGLDRPQVTV